MTEISASVFAVLFAFASFGLPYLSGKVRRDPSLGSACMVVMTCHQIVSLLQVKTGGLPTMQYDPLRFHWFAMNGTGSLDEPYGHFLHSIYSSLGPSHLLGCEVSNIIFAGALIAEIEIICLLGWERVAPKLILLFGLLPSCILNTSVTLREAAQMMLFLTLALLLLTLARKGFTASTLAILPVSYLLVQSHQGFAAILVVVLLPALGWALKDRPAILVVFVIVAATGLFFFRGSLMSTLTAHSAALTQISSGNLDYIETYAENVEDSRTSFGVFLRLDSLESLLQTGPLLFFYYLYSPLPWQLRGVLDFFGIFESFIRLGLTWSALLAIKNAKGTRKTELLLLLMLFLVVEAAWAAGTANWGTAFRHRLSAWGLLVAMGGPGFFNAAVAGTDGASKAAGGERTSALSVRGRRRALGQRRKSSPLSGQDEHS